MVQVGKQWDDGTVSNGNYLKLFNYVAKWMEYKGSHYNLFFKWDNDQGAFVIILLLWGTYCLGLGSYFKWFTW